MTLTVTRDKIIPLGGGVKKVYYTISDSDGSGGVLDLSEEFNHILNANITDITTAVFVSATWTDDSESIIIGSEGSASDTYKLSVEGW